MQIVEEIIKTMDAPNQPTEWTRSLVRLFVCSAHRVRKKTTTTTTTTTPANEITHSRLRIQIFSLRNAHSTSFPVRPTTQTTTTAHIDARQLPRWLRYHKVRNILCHNLARN